MSSRRARRASLPAPWLISAVLVGCAFAGCDRPASDLRQWSPKDHHHNETPQQPTPRATENQSTGEARATLPGLDDVTVESWKRNCTPCHGGLGRGDTMQGRQLKARDLSDPEWHKTITDEQIATSIRQGKGAMPPARLPETTIQGLVKLVRLLNTESELWKKQREAQAQTQPASSATPANSAEPTGSAAPTVKPTTGAQGNPAQAQKAPSKAPAAKPDTKTP